MTRTAPSMMVMCLAAVLALTTAVPTHAESARNLDDLAEQIRQTDEQLAALKQTIDQNNLLKQELQSAFDLARQNRTEREQRLMELGDRISQYDQRLIDLQTELANAEASVSQRKAQLAAVLRSSQNLGTSTLLQTLLQHDDPAQAQRLATYSEYLFDAQQQTVRSAASYLSKVEQARLTLLKDRNWLDHIRNKATSQRDAYDDNARINRQQLDSVDSQLQQNTRSVAELEQDQQRLQSLIDELESLQRGGSGYFKALQGKLALPVAGDIKARFGQVKSVGKLRWNGVFIAAGRGNPVKAVADGEVVYSDWLQGFGMLVIIDHGDGFMTLYGGNRTVNALQGVWVESGSTIATVGDSGGQSTSGLYFEIRQNATALDPQDWLLPTSS